MNPRRAVLPLIVALIVTTVARADELPRGALVRLGSTRFRHQGGAWGLAFSPDGKTLATRTADSVVLFDAATGRETGRVEGGSSLRGPTLAFAPDGQTLAFELNPGAVVLWDVAGKQPRRTLALPSGGRKKKPNGALCFSPDGKLLAAVDDFQFACVLEMATGKARYLVGDGQAHVTCLAFTPDGKALLLGTRHGANLWDTATGKLVRAVEVPKDVAVSSVAFAPDGKTLALGCRNLVLLGDPATGKEVGRFEATGMQSVAGLAFIPDGKTLLTAGDKLRVWDLTTRKERFTLDTRMAAVRSLAVSPDSKTAAVGTAYTVLRLYNVGSGKELFPEPQGHDGRVSAVAFTPDGKTLISGGENDPIHLWDVATGRLLGARQARAVSLSVTPDGKRFAAADEEAVRVWTVRGGGEPLVLEAPKLARGVGAAFAAGGSQLVALDWPWPPNWQGEQVTARLVVWDAASGRKLRSFTLPELWPQALAVPASGAMAAVAAIDGIHLYDLRDGRRFLLLADPDVLFWSALAFTPDDRLLVGGGLDGEVRLWEVATGRPALSFKGQTGRVVAVAISPDGRLLATSDGLPPSTGDPGRNAEPRRIRLWDIASSKQLAAFEGHTQDVTSLSFSPDGTRLASGLVDGTILVWDAASARRPAAAEAAPWTRDQRDALWADLASGDAATGWKAVATLSQAPRQAVPLLNDRLRPATAAEAERIARLVAQLDSDSFEDREKASKELEALGERAVPALQEALQGKPSPEVRRRGEVLLEKARLPLAGGEVLRSVRAVQALERAGTPEALALLRRLAAGAADARVTEEAKGALSRQGGRTGAAP